MEKEVALRTLAAQNTHRKRKLGDLKDIIGEVSSSVQCFLETILLKNRFLKIVSFFFYY